MLRVPWMFSTGLGTQQSIYNLHATHTCSLQYTQANGATLVNARQPYLWRCVTTSEIQRLPINTIMYRDVGQLLRQVDRRALSCTPNEETDAVLQQRIGGGYSAHPQYRQGQLSAGRQNMRSRGKLLLNSAMFDGHVRLVCALSQASSSLTWPSTLACCRGGRRGAVGENFPQVLCKTRRPHRERETRQAEKSLNGHATSPVGDCDGTSCHTDSRKCAGVCLT